MHWLLHMAASAGFETNHVSSVVPHYYCICLSSRNFLKYHINNDSNDFSSLS